jgi:hypothetical protein
MKNAFMLILILPITFVLGMAAAGSNAGAAPEIPKVLRAERFELVDAGGNVIGSWGADKWETSLQVGSSEKGGVCVVRTTEGGAAHVIMKNPTTKSMLAGGINPSGVIEAVGTGPNQPKATNPRLEVILGNYPNFMFRVCDQDGKTVIAERPREEK